MHLIVDENNNMLQIFSLIFFLLCGFGVPVKATNKDVEMVAKLRLDPGFLRRIQNSMNLEAEVFKNVNSLDMRFAKIEMNEVDDFLEKIIDNRQSRKRGEREILTDLAKYEDRAQKKGLESLKAVSDHLQGKLEMDSVIVTPILNKICFQFVSKLKSYFAFLSKKNPHYEIDKEYLVLDMVNIVSVLLNSVEKTLLNEILSRNNSISKEDKQIFTETINIYNMNNKKREMRHVCKKMGVCRPCPGFSDYFVKILSEVLKLYDVKFQYFIVKSTQLLNGKRVFLQTILTDEIIDWFREGTTNIMNASITDVREIISVLRSGVSQRQRLISTEDDGIKTKTKAARILIDIIDKTFDITGDDYIYMQLESTVSAIQEWAASQRNDIESILNTFINQIVSTLKLDLTATAMVEIRTLGDIIFYGRAVDKKYIEEYLMEKGSKFVRELSPRIKQLNLE